MSIAKVAEMAGVSQTTVSLVINGDNRITPKTAQNVKNAMQKIGYVPKHPNARPGPRRSSDSTVRTGNIALVVLGEHNASPEALLYRLMAGAERVLSQHGINLLLSRWLDERELPSAINSRNVDGLIVVGDGFVSKEVEQKLEKFPVIWVSSFTTDSEQYVIGGHDTSGRLAADYLIKKGYKSLAMLDPLPGHPAHIARREGFEFTAYRAGVEVCVIKSEDECYQDMVHGGFDQEKAASCITTLVDKLLDLSPRPEGVFIPTDRFTAMVYYDLYKRGVMPCRDISIVSCNNCQGYLDGLYPRPATVDIDNEATGEHAAGMLLTCINQRQKGSGIRIVITPKIIEGD